MQFPSTVHVAFFLIEWYGEAIVVERGLYLGFPGDRVRPDETVALCARRVTSSLGRSIDESSLFQVVGGFSQWDRSPASFDIFATRESDVSSLKRSLATFKRRKNYSFDQFVEVFMRAPHRIPQHALPARKKTELAA